MSASARPLTLTGRSTTTSGSLLSQGDTSSSITAAEAAAAVVAETMEAQTKSSQHAHVPHGWLPSRGTLVFLLVILHLAALCYWLYLMYLSHRRAKAEKAARVERREPPPKVNCTYEWATLQPSTTDAKGFFSRYFRKPLLEKKNSGRAINRSELATMGISGIGMPTRPRITRSPTLPPTPELI